MKTAFSEMNNAEFEELLERQETIVRENVPLYPRPDNYLEALREIKRLRDLIRADLHGKEMPNEN